MSDYFFSPLVTFALLIFIGWVCAIKTALVVHTAKEIAKISKPPVLKGRNSGGRITL